MAMGPLARPVSATQQKYRWSDELDNDEFVFNFPLHPSPPIVIGPDENGLKKVIEYKLLFIDDDAADAGNNNKVKVTTTTTQIRKLGKAQLRKRALERRAWAKFGDAVHEEDVGARLTMVSTEEIILERPTSWAPGLCPPVNN